MHTNIICVCSCDIYLAFKLVWSKLYQVTPAICFKFVFTASSKWYTQFMILSLSEWKTMNRKFYDIKCMISLNWLNLNAQQLAHMSLDWSHESQHVIYGPVFSYMLRYIVGFGMVEMAISINRKPTVYRQFVASSGPAMVIYWRWKDVFWWWSVPISNVWSHEKTHTRCIDKPWRIIPRSIAEISPNIRW